MKRTSKKLFLYSLTSLAVTASSLAAAETLATVPTLEGGVTVALGTFYLAPSADAQEYGVVFSSNGEFATTNENIVEVNPGYDFGFEAALGYVFEDTANEVELLYRTLHTSDNDSILEEGGVLVPLFPRAHVTHASSSLVYDLNAVDLMFSQFLDMGTHVQMRFAAGASYVNLKKEQNSIYRGDQVLSPALAYSNHSKFSGFGPRLGADARYDFGQGLGILGGASLAYYLGELDVNDQMTASSVHVVENVTDDIDNHGVTNLRANVAVDYVYFFDNEDLSTVGFELGYLVDYYADAIQQLGYLPDSEAGGSFPSYDGTSNSNSLAFSGPYFNIKAAF